MSDNIFISWSKSKSREFVQILLERYAYSEIVGTFILI